MIASVLETTNLYKTERQVLRNKGASGATSIISPTPTKTAFYRLFNFDIKILKISFRIDLRIDKDSL